MAQVAEIRGVEEAIRRLATKLKKMEAEAKDAVPTVQVGYAVAYALPVHEASMSWKGVPRDPRKRDIGGLGGPKFYHQKNPRERLYNPKGKFWDPQGKATNKFLETPARELSGSGELGRVIRETYQNTGSMRKAMIAAGLRLQRESQKLVPVDFGALKASAYTAVEQEAEAVAAAAQARAEAKRQKK